MKTMMEKLGIVAIVVILAILFFLTLAPKEIKEPIIVEIGGGEKLRLEQVDHKYLPGIYEYEDRVIYNQSNSPMLFSDFLPEEYRPIIDAVNRLFSNNISVLVVHKNGHMRLIVDKLEKVGSHVFDQTFTIGLPSEIVKKIDESI